MRILVVEDDKSINKAITKTLQAEHYSVDSCYDGAEALDYINSTAYDAIILDIMLPKVDGLSVLKQMRDNNNKTRVLLLTARDSLENRVEGLDMGADDYLIKPFFFKELLARLRVLIRRSSNHSDNVYELDNLQVDTAAKTVQRDGKEIELSSKEYAILEYLIQNTGNYLTREQILEHVWNYDYEGGSNIVDVYVRYLRKKIDENFDKKLIHTRRGTGYTLKVQDE